MKTGHTLSLLLVLSAVFLGIGGLLLHLYGLVPVSLTASTIAAILLILAVAYFAWKNSFAWITFGALLAIASMVFNSILPEHIDALLHPFVSPAMTIIVVAEVLGFYALPLAYLAIYGTRYRDLRMERTITRS